MLPEKHYRDRKRNPFHGNYLGSKSAAPIPPIVPKFRHDMHAHAAETSHRPEATVSRSIESFSARFYLPTRRSPSSPNAAATRREADAGSGTESTCSTAFAQVAPIRL